MDILKIKKNNLVYNNDENQTNFLEDVIGLRVFSGEHKRTTYVAVLRSGEAKRIGWENYLLLNDCMKCDISIINREEQIFSSIKERLRDAKILYWTPNKECWGIKYVDKKCIKFLIFKSKTFKDIRRFYNALNSSQVFLANRSSARYIIKESSFSINEEKGFIQVSNCRYTNGLSTCLKIAFIKYTGIDNKLLEKNYQKFEKFWFS